MIREMFVDAIGRSFEPMTDVVITSIDVKAALAEVKLRADEARAVNKTARAAKVAFVAAITVIGTVSMMGNANAQPAYYAYQVYRYAAPLQGLGRCPGCGAQLFQQYGPGIARGGAALGGPFSYQTTPALPRGYYAAPPSYGYGFRR